QHLRTREQRRQIVNALDAQDLEPLALHVRIERNDMHPKRVCARRYFAADASEADDAKGAATHFGAEKIAPLPSSRTHRVERARQMPNERQQRAEEQLGNGDRVATWGVDDGDAECGGRGKIDVVGADAGTPNHTELPRLAQQLARQLCRAASDKSIVLADLANQLTPRTGRSFIDDKRWLGAE